MYVVYVYVCLVCVCVNVWANDCEHDSTFYQKQSLFEEAIFCYKVQFYFVKLVAYVQRTYYAE